MALDTLKFRSPYLADDVAAAIELCLVLRTAVDCPTGAVLYELMSGTLEGSYDARISVRVQREEWVIPASLPTQPMGRVPRPRPILRPCPPFLEVEASVHKAMLGHNVYGGPCDVLSAATWFIAFLSESLGVGLPSAPEWLLRRVDWAEVYKLPYKAIEQYVHGLNNAAFPMRNVTRYGDQSLSAPGSTTTVKLYHKGPEFMAHDRKRLKALLSPDQLANLQAVADELLRVEVSIKARKLDEDFGHQPSVAEVTEAYLLKVYDREVLRLLREGGAAMRTVRKHRDVKERLFEVYEPRLAGLLFGTWLQFAALGERVAREQMPRATFYRYRKQLQEAGVAWHGADVRIVETASILPADFSPVRSDPRRVVGEDERVKQLLLPFREHAA